MVERRVADEELEIDDVCSLCGDIGFRDALLLCRKCGFRHQHTYCSRLYPEIDMERWCCEWCLYEREEEEKKDDNKRRGGKVFEFLLEIAQSLPENLSPPTFKANTNTSSSSSIEEKRICRRDDRMSVLATEKRCHHQVGSTTETSDRAAALKKNGRLSEKNKKALDRWRSLAKNKLGCRRYKLLADVHC